jgi:general secretion pathway protein K
MLLPGQLDPARARTIIASRPAQGWESVSAFWNGPSAYGITPMGDVISQPQVRTRWFALDLDVEVGGAQVSEAALIDGGLAPPRLVSRRWGSDE